MADTERREPEAPIFGVNGAVLNSATMTDALRAQYETKTLAGGPEAGPAATAGFAHLVQAHGGALAIAGVIFIFGAPWWTYLVLAAALLIFDGVKLGAYLRKRSAARG